MALLEFRYERCKGCGLCVEVCPKDLLRISSEINASGYPVVQIKDMEACTGCSLCAEMCPDLVITVYR